MTTPPLRRAALAAAVVFSLSTRAAAQSDAAFASSLSEAPPAFAALAPLKAKSQKPAPAPKAPEAGDAVWQKVLETVKRDGAFKPGGALMPSVFSIEDVVGDPKGDRVEQGVSFLGLVNDEEQFEAMGALFVVSTYTLDPKSGNTRIDQWLFETDVYGTVANAGHGAIVQGPDGKRISAVPEKLNPADPKIQAQYDAMLKHWAERKPKGE